MKGSELTGCKRRGEWAELCFMARAAGEGLSVSKPYGDSALYDVAVEHHGRFLRVQVKSTLYRRRTGEFSLNIMGPGRAAYPPGSVDFFAVYLIPLDTWYIIPYSVLGGGACTLHLRTHGGRQKYSRYREAWHLLRARSLRRPCPDCPLPHSSQPDDEKSSLVSET